MNQLIISLFKGYSDTCPTDASLESVVEMIRRDAALADHTEKHRYYRRSGQERAAGREKAACPCFAVAVRFSGGKRTEHICGWTSLCLADFDHLPAESLAECLRLVREDPHTLLAYTTVSGTGLRVIARYRASAADGGQTERELHAQAFDVVNRHYAALIGHDYDRQCRNATRLSGLAHDPEVLFNPDAEPFVIEAAQKAARSESGNARSRKVRLKRVVAEASALLAEEGVVYEEHHHNEYIMRMGYLLNAYGVDLEDATQWALQEFADYDGDVEGILRSCYRRTEEHGTRHCRSKAKGADDRRDAGNMWASVEAIETFLASQGRYRKNTVTGKCEYAPQDGGEFTDVTDRLVSELWRRMCKEVGATRINDIHHVLQSEFVELYNPFAHYRDSLPAWDGVTDHIAALAARVHVKHGAELFATFFKKWLVAMIASLLDEEVVNHEILVLIGRQGIYKTTFLNNLLPPDLRRYFYLKSDSRRITKDDMLTLSEFAMVCLEELDEMESKDVNQLKALTTMRHVNERAAYARFKEMRPHIASFCGTSNNRHFLTDLSGNRRWMPFEVESIDSPYEHPVDYEGVYAQAFALAADGFPYWLEDHEIRALNVHNKHFEVPCLEQELILTHYRRPMDGEQSVFVTTAQVLARINAGLRHKLSTVKINTVMQQEGFETLRVGNKRGYRVVELTGDEIYRNQQALARLLGN